MARLSLLLLPLLSVSALPSAFAAPAHAQNPLGQRQARPFAGTFTGQDLTLELAWDDAAAGYSGTITYGGDRMPCQASERDGRLQGSFTAGADRFEFTLEAKGQQLVLSSGGAEHVLRRADGGVPRPAEPAAAPTGYPAWLLPGARATYYSGTATLPTVSSQLVEDDDGNWVDGNGQRYREDQVFGTGGAGYTQYDFVSVAPDCLGANMTTYVFADAQLQTVTLAASQGLSGDRNGLTDIWLPPARLSAMQEEESPGYRVRRLRYPLQGRTYDAITTQVKGKDSYMRHTYDLATGLLLVYSSSTTGKPVMTPSGDRGVAAGGATTITSVQLRNLRQVRLPWTGQRPPQWLRQGHVLSYGGTYRNSLAEGLLAPWRYGLQITIDRRVGDCLLGKLTSRLDYATGQPPQDNQSTQVYGPGSFASLFLDARSLAELQPGQVLDTDPLTAVQLVFQGSDGRHATLLQQGRLEQQSFTYDLENGCLVATSVRRQQGPAVLDIQLQLAR